MAHSAYLDNDWKEEEAEGDESAEGGYNQASSILQLTTEDTTYIYDTLP